MSRYLAFLAVAVIAMVSFLGFQGKKSKDTPVYVFDDMDYQNKYKAQGENTFFADGRDARPPVAGTVARGNALEPSKVFSPNYRRTESLNPSFVTGKDAKGAFLVGFPAKSLATAKGELQDYAINDRVLEVGRGKFQIYCAVCHGLAADGNGIMKTRSKIEGDVAIVTIANLQAPIIRGYPNGQIFDVITNGKNTMMGYGDKLSPEERWAVVAYVRALQLSQNCPADLVPAAVKAQIK
ncbi:MAG: cytochrome c [Verrucomicrobiota bacterium]|jgi:mono/diheme cytochrome c family protein